MSAVSYHLEWNYLTLIKHFITAHFGSIFVSQIFKRTPSILITFHFLSFLVAYTPNYLSCRAMSQFLVCNMIYFHQYYPYRTLRGKLIKTRDVSIFIEDVVGKWYQLFSYIGPNICIICNLADTQICSWSPPNIHTPTRAYAEAHPQSTETWQK